MSTESAAKLFRKNETEMFQGIAPAGQSNLGLASSFNGAVRQLNIAPSLPDNDNNDAMRQKQELAMRVDDTGYSLKESLRVLPQPKMGDAGFMGAKVGEACTELTSQVFNLLGPKPEDDMKSGYDNKFAPSPMQQRPAMGMGLGMG